MKVALGFDHGGFILKHHIIDSVNKAGHKILDCGTFDDHPVDYPDYAKAVAWAIMDKKADRGIIVCGSGVGACVAANKINGIRAGLCHDTYSAHQGVEHDDINILCLGARIIGPELATEIINSFLMAKFTNEERHVRRLQKIRTLEEH